MHQFRAQWHSTYNFIPIILAQGIKQERKQSKTVGLFVRSIIIELEKKRDLILDHTKSKRNH